MFKWFKRLAFGAGGLLLLALITGWIYEQWSRYQVAQKFAPPGTLIEVNGKRSHLHCTGEGSPTVILEAGLDAAGSQAWETVRQDISQSNRVCAYDRAGIMWSDRRNGPRDAEQITTELHDLLAAANEAPPYVMVGHSLGGPLVRVFAHRFNDEVVGFVFVDSSHPEQNERFPQEIVAATPSPPPLLIKTLATFGIIRLLTQATPNPSPQHISEATLGYRPQSAASVVDEAEMLATIFTQAQNTGPFENVPMVVLTAGKLPDPLPPGLDADAVLKMQDVWFELHTELAELSTNTDHRIISDASHYIHWDDPEAVIAAIRDVVIAQREGIAVGQAAR